MVWMAIALDSGAHTITRPVGLDMVEQFLNDGTALERWTNRMQARDAIASGDWSVLAAEVGVTASEVECFLSDAWGEDRDVFLAGIGAALEMADRDERIRFMPALAQRAGVGFEVGHDADQFTVVLYAPETVAR